jgi:hypothetical protein
MDEYQYSFLRLGESMRIIRLLPGSGSLVCNLVAQEARSNQAYEALSYT